jgi:hypothetical protein
MCSWYYFKKIVYQEYSGPWMNFILGLANVAKSSTSNPTGQWAFVGQNTLIPWCAANLE